MRLAVETWPEWFVRISSAVLVPLILPAFGLVALCLAIREGARAFWTEWREREDEVAEMARDLLGIAFGRW
jgi:hypothetical protein